MSWLAFTSLYKGYQLLWKPGFKKYIIIPLAINSTIFLSLTTVSAYYTWHLFSQFQFNLPSWLYWAQPIVQGLSPFLFWIGWLGAALFILFAMAPIATLLTNLVAAPFNSLLCEKILTTYSKSSIPPSPWRAVVKEALLRELQKMFYFLPKMAVLFLIFAACYFIPIINVFAAVIFYGFSSWLLSLEYLDYPGETLRLSFNQVKAISKTNRLIRLNFGLSAMLFASVPILNLICVPVSVAGASLLWIHSFENAPKDKLNTPVKN